MDATLALSLALCGLIGFALAAFGGGGSILAVPVLVFVTRVAPSTAVAMSLAIVGTTSLAASYAHHQRGQVRLGVAVLFGGSGILTAFLGARLTHLVSGRVLMLSFAALMVLVGIRMFPGRPGAESAHVRRTPARPRVLQAVVAGGAVGAVTGFLGVGGGFLVVPALIAFTGLGMREAIGTSLLVIAINSAAGFVGHIGSEGLDLGLAAIFTPAAIVGAMAGERVARSVSIDKLRGGFALFVTAVGITVGAVVVMRGTVV